MTSEEQQLLQSPNNDNKLWKYLKMIDKETRECLIILTVTIIIVIILAILGILIPFLLSHKDHHNPVINRIIKIYNNCPQAIFPIIMRNSNQITSGWLLPGNSYNFTRSLNEKIKIIGCVDNVCEINGNLPLTHAIFNFSHQYYDIYDIDFTQGYNIPISIQPIKVIDQNWYVNVEMGMCTTTKWNHIITEGTCPSKLRSYKNDSYLGCNNPCVTFRQAKYCCWAPYKCFISNCTGNSCTQYYCNGLNWPNNYGSVFNDACPTCSITRCYFYYAECSSNSDYNPYVSYQVTFCPIN